MKPELRMEFDDQNLYVFWKGRVHTIPLKDKDKDLLESKVWEMQLQIIDEILNGPKDDAQNNP